MIDLDLDLDEVLAGSFEQTRHNSLERVSVTKPSLALVVEMPIIHYEGYRILIVVLLNVRA